MVSLIPFLPKTVALNLLMHTDCSILTANVISVIGTQRENPTLDSSLAQEQTSRIWLCFSMVFFSN